MSIWTGKTIGKTEKGDQFNAAVAVDANPPEVRQLWNYYTFCFPAGSIPSSFWRHYTEYLKTKDLPKATPDQRGHWNDKDRIIVYLFGETGSSGGKFMISRKYHYKEGYFSYEKHGFGPVVKTEEELIDALLACIQNDFKMEK